MTIKAVPKRQLIEAILRKGFVEDVDGPARDHHYYYLWVEGKKSMLRVKLSRGATELAREEIKRNASTFGITGDDFWKILVCEHDHARTLQVWRASPKYIPPAR